MPTRQDMIQQVNFNKVAFLISAFALKQLPDTGYPEIAFAGRSNVGKSSLINRLVGRTSLVKTSSKPGKTQSLNYFTIDDQLYLVDLPGYGFAKVSKQVQNQWLALINGYLENREPLKVVVVIIDIRHELKQLDRDLVDWLRYHDIACQLVYTKADKLPKNRQIKNAAALDAGLSITANDRIVFSAKTGQGLDALKQELTERAKIG
ncbi:ribosome biogenesis GTP-binding protein YihA/YsxC [Desulfogranum marinum]|uniref:ribosome biogenesis GTP-binding protein YihA/YsxC n=1 Tax=Desulfogranum marinum TaxID=453220 RepID=UPI001E4503FD|nr:ribosome biogenesis GTP-binding protein YihA/YsxC [Desulfogranum marinum]